MDVTLARLSHATNAACIVFRSFPSSTTVLDALRHAYVRYTRSPLQLIGLGAPQLVKIAYYLNIRDRLALLYTCTTFRAALVTEPQLWASVSFGLRDYQHSPATYAETVLARAASQPVRLRFTASMPEAFLHDPGIDTLITKYLNRLSVLDVSLVDATRDADYPTLDEAFAHLSTTLRGPALILSSFRLAATMIPGDLFGLGDRSTYSYVLPPDLFGGQHPELQQLSLQGIRLPAGVQYHILCNITVLHYASSHNGVRRPASHGSLLQSDLDAILSQATRLEHLSLKFASYVPDSQGVNVASHCDRYEMLRYVRLRGFDCGRLDMLRRFAHAPAVDVVLAKPVRQTDFNAWPNARLSIFVLTYIPGRRKNLYKRSVANSEDSVSVFLSPYVEAFSSIPLDMVTTITLSVSLLDCCSGWSIELPHLSDLRLMLPTCLEEHLEAGVLWQTRSGNGENRLSCLSSPQLKRIFLIALHTYVLPHPGGVLTSCQSSLLGRAASRCPQEGVFSLSLREVSDFLAALLPEPKGVEQLTLVGITDIIDIDLGVAFSAVLSLAASIDFASAEAIRYEEKKISLKAIAGARFPDDDKLNDFDLQSPFERSWLWPAY